MQYRFLYLLDILYLLPKLHLGRNKLKKLILLYKNIKKYSKISGSGEIGRGCPGKILVFATSGRVKSRNGNSQKKFLQRRKTKQQAIIDICPVI